MAVAGYHVFRDGNATAIATVTTGTSYQDPGLAPGSTHSYTVSAFDAVPNESAKSSPPASATTNSSTTTTFTPVADSYVDSSTPTSNFGTNPAIKVDASPATVRSYLKFTLSGLTGTVTSATLRVFTNTAQSVGYDVFGVTDTSWIESGAGGITFNNAPALAATKTGSSGPVSALAWTTVNVTPLVAGNGTISIALTTTSSTALSMQSRTGTNPPQLVVTATTPSNDTVAPSVPSGVQAVANGTDKIDVSWTASTDNVAVVGYHVFRDGNATAIATVTTGTNYQDPGLAPGSTHSYTVSAFDAVPNESAKSSPPASATTANDTAAPSVPTGVQAVANGTSRIDVSWTASTDNVAVTGYHVFRDTVQVGNVTSGTSFPDLGLTPGSTHSYTVTAYDAVPNESAQSSPPVSATTALPPDTVAPSVPTGVAAVANGTDKIDVSWTASTDNVAVAGYHVFRDGNATAIATVTTGTNYQDPGLAPGSTHSYTVSAFDAVPNESAKSSPPASATTGVSTETTFTAVADSYVDSSQASSNFGTNPALRVDSSPTIRTYLKFTLSGLTGTVNQATLRVFATSAQPTGYDVFAVSDTSWIESGAGSLTFNNAPPLAATKTGSSGPVFAGTWTTVNVTPLVSGNGTITIALTTTNTIALAMQSRTGGTNPPQLIVTTS